MESRERIGITFMRLTVQQDDLLLDLLSFLLKALQALPQGARLYFRRRQPPVIHNDWQGNLN
jgi:hypothetical protein